MDEWLDKPRDECDAKGDNCRLSRKNRIQLALSLALCIIQLYETAWIGQTWTWRNFSVAKENREENPQLFVRTRFYSAQVPNPEQPAATVKSWLVLGEPVLIRLGFALIELALEKRLVDLGGSAARAGIQPLNNEMRDYEIAMDLLEENKIRDAEGEVYQNIVRACLTCCVIGEDGAIALTSKAPTFHEDLEQYVATPLKDYCEMIWPGSATVY
jgi:hypothetical protein